MFLLKINYLKVIKNKTFINKSVFLIIMHVPKSERSIFRIGYTFDFGRSKKQIDGLLGLVSIEIDGQHLFERIEEGHPRGDFCNPISYFKWFLDCLGNQLSYDNAPQGRYRNGVDVWQKYKHQCIYPLNMLPTELPDECKVGSPEFAVSSETEDGPVEITLSDLKDPWSSWCYSHLISRGPVGPEQVCMQRWPRKKEMIEISWSLPDAYRNREGAIFVPLESYIAEIIRSSESVLQLLRNSLGVEKDRGFQGLEEKLGLARRMYML